LEEGGTPIKFAQRFSVSAGVLNAAIIPVCVSVTHIDQFLNHFCLNVYTDYFA
jgi:hypothetical protein